MDSIFDSTGKILIGAFGLVMLVIALKIASGAKKAQYADTARTSVNVIVAMVFVAIGLGAIVIPSFGKKILSAFGIS